jgi:hypothetical protein
MKEIASQMWSRHDVGPASVMDNDAFSFWKPPDSWRVALGASVARSRMISEWYLLERYLEPRSENAQTARNFYYAIKDYVPTRFRHFFRSMLCRMRSDSEFPRWPCEDALLLFLRDWILNAQETAGDKDGWHVGFWPHNNNCCVVLTHDVESTFGFNLIEPIAEL